jgi:NADP-dependent 3-hydroxy acid dehydrogenase YdfG
VGEPASQGVAVVTGAGGAVGSALVAALVAAGFDVHAVHRSAPSRAAGVTAHAADLSDTDELEALCAELAVLPAVDLLVHAAGAYERGAGDEVRERLAGVNVRAPLALTRALLPRLRSARGDVVFVNSSVAVRAAEGEIAAYAASRQAQRAAADALRAEENSRGVRVASVFLGRTAGPLQERIHRDEGREYRPDRLLQPEDVARIVLDLVELPPSAEVTEVHVRPRFPPGTPA